MRLNINRWFWLVDAALILGLALLVWIFAPTAWVEWRYQRQKSVGTVLTEKTVPVAAPLTGFSGLFSAVTGGFADLSANQESLIVPVSSEFGLIIPKIFANVAVTPDVNPADPKIYQDVLRQAGGVAHAAGSALPDEDGTIYIFGHSTDADINVARYNAVFYLLRKLEPGDLIQVYFQGQEYRYQVIAKKTVDPTDIADITSVTGQRRLVLQTCWPPGTTWKRLLIIAEPETSL